MNTTASTDIRKKAKKGIDQADDTTVRMILAMLDVKSEEEAVYEREMLRRINEYEQGMATTYTFDEVVANARTSYPKKHLKSLKND